MTGLSEAEFKVESGRIKARSCCLSSVIIFLLGMTFLTCTLGRYVYHSFFEKHILLVSSSPDHTYQITAIRYGDVTAWGGDVFSDVILKESITGAETEIGTIYDGVTAQLSITWPSDDLALITTSGRDNQTYQYEFNARKKQFKQVKNDNF